VPDLSGRVGASRRAEIEWRPWVTGRKAVAMTSSDLWDAETAKQYDETAAFMFTPGIVFVGGSGSSDRDNDGFFRPIRAHFVAAGVAVLTYDKRGVGASGGVWATATLEELASDAAAALGALQREPAVAHSRTVLFGHSEGGWVALRATVAGAPVAGLILNSCPATPFLDAEMHALVIAGADSQEAAEAVEFLRTLGEFAAGGAPIQIGERAVAEARQQRWFRALETAGFELNHDMWSQAGVWCTYDPKPDLSRCTTPVLATFGQRDPLVPVEASVREYQSTARSAGRAQQIRVFAGRDHRLAVRGSNSPGSCYLRALTAWVECSIDASETPTRDADRNRSTTAGAAPHASTEAARESRPNGTRPTSRNRLATRSEASRTVGYHWPPKISCAPRTSADE